MRFRFFAFCLLLCLVSSEAWGFVWPSQLQRWQVALASPSSERRYQTLIEIGHESSPGLEPLVERALEDSEGYIKRAAAQIVAKHRYSLAEKVIPWLSSEQAELKLAAAQVLARLPLETASDGLTHLLFDKDLALRSAAVTALGQLVSREATSALLVALNDSSDSVRRTAIRSLSYQGDPRVDVALAGKLTDIEPTVRADVVSALVARGRLEDESLRRQIVSDKNHLVRAAVARALGDFPEKQTQELLLNLLADERSPHVLKTVAVALSRSGSSIVVPELFRIWQNLEQGEARSTIEAMVRGVPRLAQRMSETCFRDAVVGDAVQCLGFCGKWGCDIASVIRLAKSHKIRTEVALEVCGRAALPDGLDWVLSQFDWTDERRQSVVLDALGQILETEPSGLVVDSLTPGLAALEVDTTLFERVVRLLGQSGSSRAKALLLPIALDPTSPERVVVEAIVALGRLGAEGLDPSIWPLLNHSSERVAVAVADAFYANRTKLSPLPLFAQGDLWATRRSLRFVVISSLLATSTDNAVWPKLESLLTRSRAGDRDALLEGLARNETPDALLLTKRLVAQASVADRRKLAEAWGAGGSALRELLPLATDRAASVRANALWSLGRLGSRTQWATLVVGLDDTSVEVASNAMIALGRVAERERSSVTVFACPLLSSRSVTQKEAALIALRLAKERCPGGLQEQALLRAPEESLRRSAALLIASTRQAQDTTPLRLCASFDSSAAVRGFCAGTGLAISRGRAELPRLVYVVPDGQRDAMSGVEYGVVGETGLIRYGLTDRRGAFFAVGPEGYGLSLRQPPDDATLLH